MQRERCSWPTRGRSPRSSRTWPPAAPRPTTRCCVKPTRSRRSASSSWQATVASPVPTTPTRFVLRSVSSRSPCRGQGLRPVLRRQEGGGLLHLPQLPGRLRLPGLHRQSVVRRRLPDRDDVAAAFISGEIDEVELLHRVHLDGHPAAVGPPFPAARGHRRHGRVRRRCGGRRQFRVRAVARLGARSATLATSRPASSVRCSIAASEHANRQRAMKSATDNAEELITGWPSDERCSSGDHHQIMEIVGGAEALDEAVMVLRRSISRACSPRSAQRPSPPPLPTPRTRADPPGPVTKDPHHTTPPRSTMTVTENDLKNGRIVGIAGPVVDVEFGGRPARDQHPARVRHHGRGRSGQRSG